MVRIMNRQQIILLNKLTKIIKKLNYKDFEIKLGYSCATLIYPINYINYTWESVFVYLKGTTISWELNIIGDKTYLRIW